MDICMFTGLVETTGTILDSRPIAGNGRRITVAHRLAGEELELGESIAVDGVCLTVVSRERDTDGEPRDPDAAAGRFDAELSAETLARTTLGQLEQGTLVNLERALRVGDRLGGHLVTGHVDGVAQVVEVTTQGEMTEVWVEAPGELELLLVEKGSVTLAGVSLTVNRVEGARFAIQLIPHTRERTTLGGLTVGTPLNLEVDPIGRYVQRWLAATRQGAASA